MSLAVLLAACVSRQGAPLEHKPCAALCRIDSLMWQQPDSALRVLADFAASPEADSMDAFDGHYCQLLLSELLYKNDYAQSNRAALLQAVAYLDSLCAAGRDDLAFLDARAHYIKGVGSYESDSLVPACQAYLKALEVMENHFEDKDLVGHKARFMVYSYNRLMEMFSAQFMMEPAIVCGEQALRYCKVETTSIHGISNILYHLGIFHHAQKRFGEAEQYYRRAFESLISTDNLTYRNIVSSMTLCNYQLEKNAEPSLNALQNILKQVEDDSERLTRYLTIGAIFFEERMYDSVMQYLVPVFEKSEDDISRIQAAEYLVVVYDSLGDVNKSDECTRFLAQQKKSEGQNKALVSQLDNLFQTYQRLKQAKQAEIERTIAVRKIVSIVVSIAFVVVLTIVIVAKRRGIKRMKRCQAAADRTLETIKKKHEEEMETQRLAYQKEQNTVQQKLRDKEAQLTAMEESVRKQHEAVSGRREELLDEPICQQIGDLVQGKHITTRDYYLKHGIALGIEELKQLKEAVEKHFDGFDAKLVALCSSMNENDIELCHLYLLGLNEKEIAALSGKTYSAIMKHRERVKRKLGTDESVEEYVMKVAEGICGKQDIPQSVPQDVLQTILELVSKNPKITRDEIAAQLGVSSKTVGRYFKKIGHRVRFVGRGYSGHWEIVR